MSWYIVIYTENVREKHETSPKTTSWAIFYVEQDGDILGKKFTEKTGLSRFGIKRRFLQKEEHQ